MPRFGPVPLIARTEDNGGVWVRMCAMGKPIEGTVTEQNRGSGFGKVLLADGRELTFDVDIVDDHNLPAQGERVVLLLGPSRLGGEKVTRLARVRAPRPTLDEALSPGAIVPVGRADEMRALRHDDAGPCRFPGGVMFGDLLGGDDMVKIVDPEGREVSAVAVFQDDSLAFVRLDLAPFTAGRRWERGAARASDTGSFCLAPFAELAAAADRIFEIETVVSHRTGLVRVPIDRAELFWLSAPDGAASVHVAKDGESAACVVVDLGICATR
jgi:hypothetical protein